MAKDTRSFTPSRVHEVDLPGDQLVPVAWPFLALGRVTCACAGCGNDVVGVPFQVVVVGGDSTGSLVSVGQSCARSVLDAHPSAWRTSGGVWLRLVRDEDLARHRDGVADGKG
jgi:hypothetical protein